MNTAIWNGMGICRDKYLKFFSQNLHNSMYAILESLRLIRGCPKGTTRLAHPLVNDIMILGGKAYCWSIKKLLFLTHISKWRNVRTQYMSPLITHI